MRRLFANLSFALMVIVTLSGCSSRQRVVYIQGADEIGTFQNENPYMLTIRPDDRLSIIVSCKEAELAVPFNLSLTQKAFSSATATISSNAGAPQTFWVDQNGEIEYPTIGKLKVQGMTRYELRFDSVWRA